MVKYKVTIKGTAQLNGPLHIESSFITDDSYLALSFNGENRYQAIEAWVKKNYPDVQIPNIQDFDAKVVSFKEKMEKAAKVKIGSSVAKKGSLFSDLLSKPRSSASKLISNGKSRIWNSTKDSISSELSSTNEENGNPDADGFKKIDEEVSILVPYVNPKGEALAGFNKIKQNASEKMDYLGDGLNSGYNRLAKSSLQLKESTSNKFDSLGNSLSNTYSDLAKSTGEYYQAGNAQFSELGSLAKKQLTDAGSAMVEFKTGVSNRYEALEIKDGLLNLVSNIDTKAVVLALDQVNAKDTKTKLAISAIKQILIRLDRHNTLAIGAHSDAVSNQLNQDMFMLTNSINLKNALAIAEPFVLLIPYGGTALYIIGLFVKD